MLVLTRKESERIICSPGETFADTLARELAAAGVISAASFVAARNALQGLIHSDLFKITVSPVRINGGSVRIGTEANAVWQIKRAELAA